MATISIRQEDAEFLRDLQHELLTQTNDGNADPVFWGVIETREDAAPEGCGDPTIYMGDGGTMTTEEAVSYIENDYLRHLSEENQEEWAEVDKNDMDDVVRFMNDNLDWHEVRVVWTEMRSRVSEETGAFLTKRACQEYISRFGYNHSRPHTYAMTAYRNFELARLLKILKTIEIKEG